MKSKGRPAGSFGNNGLFCGTYSIHDVLACGCRPSPMTTECLQGTLNEMYKSLCSMEIEKKGS